MSKKTPNLFIVGAPKCGTTSMYHYLKQHPDIFFPELKEPNFFNTDLIRKNRLSEAEYFGLFQDADQERYIGEATPLYLMSKDAPKNIHALCPEAKIIIMLRRPVDLIYSAYFQNVYNAVEDITVFEEAVAAEGDRRAGKRIPLSNEPVDRLYYSKFVQFSEQVQEYQSYFPKENIHVIIYDDLRKDTDGEIAKTLDFLGLAKDVVISSEVHNESKRNKSNALHRFMQQPPKAFSKAARLVFPAPVRSKIYASARKANETKNEKKPMQSSTELMLAEKYAPEVEKIGSLLGRDLSHWNNLSSSK